MFAYDIDLMNDTRTANIYLCILLTQHICLRYDCGTLDLNNGVLGHQIDIIDTIRQRTIIIVMIIFCYHDLSRLQTYIRVCC